jgi:uncharacterized tellurite resistance protein B-like protein
MTPSIETHYWREVHGDVAPDESSIDALARFDWLKLGRAILVVAAADAPLSEEERTHFLGMAAAYGGLTEAELRALADFDPRTSPLEALLTPEYRDWSRAFLYEAIKTASVGGYTDAERRAVRRAAKLLGVDAAVVAVIEAVVEAEAAVRKARLAVLHPWRERDRA